MAEKGRKYNSQSRYIDTINPESAEQGMLVKQDEMIDKINEILVAIESATDGDTLFAALDTASIKANLSKLELK